MYIKFESIRGTFARIALVLAVLFSSEILVAQETGPVLITSFNQSSFLVIPKLTDQQKYDAVCDISVGISGEFEKRSATATFLPYEYILATITEKLSRKRRAPESLRSRVKLKKSLKMYRNRYRLNQKNCLKREASPAPTPVKASPSPEATPTPTSKPTPVLIPLKVDFSGAVGLTLRESISSVTPSSADNSATPSGSNLVKVFADGTFQDVVSSGRASIAHFLIASNGKVYVRFTTAVNLSDTSSPGTCLLAEIDRQTLEIRCLDDSAKSVEWPVQFDESGAVYYLASVSYRVSYLPVLRRSLHGEVKDLVGGDVDVDRFFVLPDGQVILGGKTIATSLEWIRKLDKNGGLTTLLDQAYLYFAYRFPDGNIYIGFNTPANQGVIRYLTQSGVLEIPPYMSVNAYYDSVLGYIEPLNNLRPYCSFVCTSGAHIDQISATKDGRVFATAGLVPNTMLLSYYPTVYRPNSKVTRVSHMIGLDNAFILAGRDAQDKHIITLLDVDLDLEVPLVGPENQIEVYRMNLLPAEGRVVFDGLRFSDNSYVIGSINLTSLNVASTTGTYLYAGFQPF